jgi:hypothetical protein
MSVPLLTHDYAGRVVRMKLSLKAGERTPLHSFYGTLSKNILRRY